MSNRTKNLTTLLKAFVLLVFLGLPSLTWAGVVEDLITSRITNPVRYQVIWEDFNSTPPLGPALTQNVGWAIHGSGSAVTQVGAALIGAGEPGEGNGTIQIATGTALNDETIIAPAFRLGLGLPPYVTRMQATRQDYVLATRVSSWGANSRQFIGIDGFDGGSLSVERATPHMPRFYWDGATWSFRAGGPPGVNIPLSVSGGGPLVFRDLLASAQGGVLKLYVDGVLVSSTAAPMISPSDAFPAMGVKTKLGGSAAAMGVDYFFWATERNPP